MQNVLKKGLASGKLPSSDPLARHVAGQLDRAAGQGVVSSLPLTQLAVSQLHP